MLYQVEERHWWSRGMRRICLELLAQTPLPQGALVEIGCGGGSFLRELQHLWSERLVFGMDLRWDALMQASQRGAKRLVLTDAGHMPLPSESCALIVALDVFDQSGIELAPVLKACRSLLRPGGCLLLRVSALSWLASPHDAAFGTGRRYHAHEMRQSLAAASLQPVRLTHANTLLLPLIATHRFLQQRGVVGAESALRTDGLWDSLWYSVLVAEAALLRRYDLPLGASLLCLAQRPE